MLRNYLLFVFLWLSSLFVSAQTFVHLDWQQPEPIHKGVETVSTDLPSFLGAAYLDESHLPYYIQQLEVENQHYRYEALVEYPEFAALTPKEIKAIKQTGVQLPNYPYVTLRYSVAAKKRQLDASFIPLVYRKGKYQRIISFKLTLLKREPLSRTPQTRVAVLSPYRNTSVLNAGKWVKIKVTQEGIHQITQSQLAQMGFPNPAKVHIYGYGGHQLYEQLSLNSRTDLEEIPTLRQGSKLLFYANGTLRWDKDEKTGLYAHTPNSFSTYSCYFLTTSEDPPLVMPVKASLPAVDAVERTTFPDYVLHEKDEYAWYEGGRKLVEAYNFKNSSQKSFLFRELEGIQPSTLKITVAATSHSMNSSTSVKVDAAQTELGSFSVPRCYSIYDYAKWKAATFSCENTTANECEVKLSFSANHDARLDYIRLNFQRSLSLTKSSLRFRGTTSEIERYNLSQCNENTLVWDITDPAHYQQLETKKTGDKLFFTADNTAITREYIAFDKTASYPSVTTLGTVKNQNLHALRAIDMVIIVPPKSELITQAERLAEYHRLKDNFTVQVVTSTQIYNEFSSGTPDATAYRRFMKMLYDTATTTQEQPRYLLLFGNSVFDNRLLTAPFRRASQTDYLLCYQSENSFSDTECYVLDDYFGFLDDNEGINLTTDKLDVSIGRLTVSTGKEAKQVVDKLVDYMDNKHAGAWKNTMTFVGDDGDNNTHMQQANQEASIIERAEPSILVKRIFFDAYKRETTTVGDRYPDVRKALLEMLENGTILFNYNGHGGPTLFSHEYVLGIEDIAAVRSNFPPLWVTASCKITPFDGTSENMGEVALLNPYGAAIGLFTTTRTVYTDRNSMINRFFIQAMIKKDNGLPRRIGDAVREAKLAIAPYGYVNSMHYVYLGDPALRLAYPAYKIVVDEFNGSAATAPATQVKAGSTVTMKGRVLGSDGNTATTYKGSLYSTIMDNEALVTTYNNSGEANRPFVYRDRTKLLFTGQNVVDKGEFSLSFPVPFDINYADESGRANLYAVDENGGHEANGSYTNFLVGGTVKGAESGKGEGPKISLYLNTPDFPSGGAVNPSPSLVIDLEDTDGINTVGNSVGHDLVAIIDNDPNQYFNLNSYYQSSLGDYTKGKVRYQFSNLAEGKHELLVRAWDVMNNSSSKVLTFEVKKDLPMQLLDIQCSQSPAKTTTTFILSHNRPSEQIEVEITVLNLAGMPVWKFQDHATSLGSYYYVDWDLKTNSGQALSPGLYLFRAKVTIKGVTSTTKTRKIVLMAQ